MVLKYNPSIITIMNNTPQSLDKTAMATAVAQKWNNDPFFAPDTVVLGLDIGIEGIGITVRRGQCIAALDLRNKPWINEKLSANLASHLPPIGKPSAEGLPDNRKGVEDFPQRLIYFPAHSSGH